MKTVQSLKNLCLFKIIGDSIKFNKVSIPVELMQEISDLHLLNAEQIVNKCINNIAFARVVLKSKILFSKLGGFEPKRKDYFSSFFSYFSIKQQDTKLIRGGYLFEFLSAHKEIYEEAKKCAGTMARLSDFQKNTLEQLMSDRKIDLYKFYRNGL